MNKKRTKNTNAFGWYEANRKIADGCLDMPTTAAEGTKNDYPHGGTMSVDDAIAFLNSDDYESAGYAIAIGMAVNALRDNAQDDAISRSGTSQKIHECIAVPEQYPSEHPDDLEWYNKGLRTAADIVLSMPPYKEK